MKLRQCVFVAADLESSREELCDTLGIEVAYRDPGVAKWGLANVVCPTGHDFLEIVSPTQPGTSAGRYIERRKGDGGYMVIIQVPDAVAERQRVTGLGVRAVEQKDLVAYKYTHFHPSDTAGVLLSLDQTIAPAGTDPKLWWPPAEKDWLKHARADVTNGLCGVEIQHTDPGAAAALWSKILNRPAKDNIISLDNEGEIRFVPIADDRGPGVSAYDVKVVDRNRHVVFEGGDKGKQVVSAQLVREAVLAMRAVVQYGTGTRAALSDREVAGKTGTSENYENAWFVGFSPQLATAVWMGSPSGNVPMRDVGGIRVFGGTYPAAIWHQFMAGALQGLPPLAFSAPNPDEIPPPEPLKVAPPVRSRPTTSLSSPPPARPASTLPAPTPTAPPSVPTTATSSPPTSLGPTSTTRPRRRPPPSTTNGNNQP